MLLEINPEVVFILVLKKIIENFAEGRNEIAILNGGPSRKKILNVVITM